MDAVEFFQTVNRLCKNRSCAGCPICKKGMIKDMCMVRRTVMLGDASVESIEEMISIVEQWAKEHPVKTRQSEFLKMFPNADMQRIYTLFPCVIDQTIRPTRCDKYKSFSSPKKCVECRDDYWNEEVPDND